MNNKPFPWNPHGFIRPSVEHLFVRNDGERKDRTPGTQPPPTLASQFTIGKRSDPQKKTKLLRASI